MTIRRHAFVRGRVQGVAFRAYAQECAWRLDLLGWIRNLPDGRSVEVMVEGEEEAVAGFVRWLGDGPPLAEVEAVEVAEVPAEGEALKPFAIQATPRGVR